MQLPVPEVEVDVKAKTGGMVLYFPWNSILIILVFIMVGGYLGYSKLNTKIDEIGTNLSLNVSQLTSTLDKVSDAANNLSDELSTVREIYTKLDTKVAVIDSRVESLEKKKN